MTVRWHWAEQMRDSATDTPLRGSTFTFCAAGTTNPVSLYDATWTNVVSAGGQATANSAGVVSAYGLGAVPDVYLNGVLFLANAPVAPNPLDIGAGVSAGTLAARPSAASAGAGSLYLATDDNGGKTYRSDGAAWAATGAGVSELPGSAPLAVATSTTAFGTTNTYPTWADVTGLTGVTFTFPASGAVNIRLDGGLASSVAGKSPVYQIIDSGAVLLWDGTATSVAASGVTTPSTPEIRLTGTPGTSKTIKAQLCGAAGAGTVSIGNGLSVARMKLEVRAA